MQGKQLFEYAVVRVVPRVEREEFLNVGIILYCRGLRYLACRYTLDRRRLDALCATLDCDEVERHLQSFDGICRGDAQAGPIAQLDVASRFRWLTATRSTVVQTSKVHPGLSSNPSETLDKLFAALVL